MNKFKINKYDWITFELILAGLVIVGIPFIVTFIYLGMLLAHKLFG
jgi:hypothetical protein